MDHHFDPQGRLPEAFTVPKTSSFAQFLMSYDPELLPHNSMRRELDAGGGTGLELEHGTTIVTATFADGVVLAGDRRATMGNMISKRDIRKVFRTDAYSAAGIAGVWSIAVEIIRLFQVEARTLREDGGSAAVPRGQGQ